ncbi:hypothetical protein HMPREF3215_00941, partial [Staphylococcus simulans]
MKSSTKSSSRLVTSQEFEDVELKFNQPINASDSKPLTQDEY